MPNRGTTYKRHAGAPMGNKHKAHRAQKHSKKCEAYRLAGTRERNQERRAKRILRGFRRPTEERQVTVRTGPTNPLQTLYTHERGPNGDKQ